MTFKCRFNATCFLFKINRFVLIFSKTSNRFVLKICSGGFADYIYAKKMGVSSKKDFIFSFFSILKVKKQFLIY